MIPSSQAPFVNQSGHIQPAWHIFLNRVHTWVGPPATLTSPGTQGQLAYDQGSLYICTRKNTWLKFTPGASIPSWGTWDMAPGTVGIAYQMEWYLEGCAIPVTFTLTSGSLPPGLSLSTLTGAEGEISGTPTTVGTYSFSLKATNAFGSASKSFSITISAAPSGGSWTFLA